MGRTRSRLADVNRTFGDLPETGPREGLRRVESGR